MAQTAEKLEIVEMPEGGIADFIKSDEEIDALERQETALELGEEGIAQFADMATKMAGYGRFGDDSIAHIQTGEIVVPKALIDDNPRLKEQIFAELREAGVEDPEQYVVGNKANSLNPDTGLMEFGFLKKLFKGVKKVFKKVGKALKKAASVVLPIALGFIPGVGPIMAASLGSGIGTLIQGGSLKDALKAGLIGAVTAGAVKGFSGPDGFFKNLTQSADGRNSFQMLRDMRAAKASQALQPGFEGTALSQATKEAVAASSPIADVTFPEISGAAQSAAPTVSSFTPPVPENLAGALAREGTTMDQYINLLDSGQLVRRGGQTVVPGAGTSGSGIASLKDAELAVQAAQDVSRGPLEKTTDFLFRGGRSPELVDAQVNLAQEKALAANLTKPEFLQRAAVERAAAAARPSLLQRFGPSAGLALAGLGAAGGFEVPEDEMPNILERDAEGDLVTGQDKIDEDPGRYLVQDLGRFRLNPETGEYEEKELLINELMPDPLGLGSLAIKAEQGGEIYPRRVGGIMPDEGVPNEDSVPAMLMPGEFVLTTDAVKGVGNGDLSRGIDNMYNIMRNLERRGRSYA